MLYRIQESGNVGLTKFRSLCITAPTNDDMGWGDYHPEVLLPVSDVLDPNYVAMTACMLGEWLTPKCMDMLYTAPLPRYSLYAIEVHDEKTLSYDYAGQCVITMDDVVNVTEITSRHITEEIVAENKSYSISEVTSAIKKWDKVKSTMVCPYHVLEPHSAVSVMVYLDGMNVGEYDE